MAKNNNEIITAKQRAKNKRLLKRNLFSTRCAAGKAGDLRILLFELVV